MGLGALALVAAAVVTTDHLGTFEVRKLKTQISELKREKAEMVLYAQRLSAARRVAQVTVVEQYDSAAAGPVTVLHWQQISPSGLLGPREIIEVKGTQVYFEALVIKFEHELVGRATPEHETSLAMFRRAFGERQAPVTGHPLDQTAPIEVAGQSRPDALHDRLWKRFWRLVDDPMMAAEYGVRVAQCEAPSVVVKPGQIWEVSLDHAGGLNIRKLADRPATETD